MSATASAFLKGADELFESHGYNPRLPVSEAQHWCALCFVTDDTAHMAIVAAAAFKGHRFLYALCKPCSARFRSATQTERSQIASTVEGNLMRGLAETIGCELESKMESPLERKVLDCLIQQFQGSVIYDSAVKGVLVNHQQVQVGCVPQFEVHLARTVRLDFAFMAEGRPRHVAMEVDGHDYHERTKEQARRDKSRDRMLTMAGWSVLRFTGSEIFNGTEACLREVLDYTVKA
jgi:hypothetical protein